MLVKLFLLPTRHRTAKLLRKITDISKLEKPHFRLLTVPTRLMPQVKQWFAIAAFLASIAHMGSLKNNDRSVSVLCMTTGRIRKLHGTIALNIPEASNSSGRVEDDFRPIHTVHEPVEWVMPPVANIHSNLTKLGLKHSMACVALHVICRL